MIGYIRGTVIDHEGNSLTLLADSVGYEISVSSLHNVTIGDIIELWIHHSIREDASDLYGFKTQGERNFMRKLLTVSGIGPKTAMNIMDGCPLPTLVTAIQNNTPAQLALFPGISKKVAEKICLELHGKVQEYSAEVHPTFHIETVQALTGLGYRESEVMEFLRTNNELPEKIEDIITLFLKRPR